MSSDDDVLRPSPAQMQAATPSPLTAMMVMMVMMVQVLDLLSSEGVWPLAARSMRREANYGSASCMAQSHPRPFRLTNSPSPICLSVESG